MPSCCAAIRRQRAAMSIASADFRVLQPRCSQLAIIRPPSRSISAFARQRSNCVSPGTVPLWSAGETLFAVPPHPNRIRLLDH
jgi:hypothetical protein